MDGERRAAAALLVGLVTVGLVGVGGCFYRFARDMSFDSSDPSSVGEVTPVVVTLCAALVGGCWCAWRVGSGRWGLPRRAEAGTMPGGVRLAQMLCGLTGLGAAASAVGAAATPHGPDSNLGGWTPAAFWLLMALCTLAAAGGLGGKKRRSAWWQGVIGGLLEAMAGAAIAHSPVRTQQAEPYPELILGLLVLAMAATLLWSLLTPATRRWVGDQLTPPAAEEGLADLLGWVGSVDKRLAVQALASPSAGVMADRSVPASPGVLRGWEPTHRIPAEGMVVWKRPTLEGEPAVTLAAGTPVRASTVSGDSIRVTESNGRTGWVDGRFLVPLDDASPAP